MSVQNVEMANMTVQDTNEHVIPNPQGNEEQPSIHRVIKDGINKVRVNTI